MSESHVRSFAALEHKPSDARLLNLRRTFREFQDDPELLMRPFFENGALNRSIIIKHHLRPQEQAEFECFRMAATKVVLPIDQRSLRSGAKSFFVGQRGYEALVRHELGLKNPEEPDLKLLNVLDKARSFDPFLLKAELRLGGFDPANCYFDLPAESLDRIQGFVEAEVAPLVDSAFGATLGQAGSLARKLISEDNTSELAPLGQALRMSAEDFGRCLLDWKALIYYKYQLVELVPRIKDLRSGLDVVKPVKSGSKEEADKLASSRNVLRRANNLSSLEISTIVGTYDAAYTKLVKCADPLGFRSFLRQAHAWTNRLGAAVAVAEHMTSFWLYHFPPERREGLTADALTEAFQLFERGVRSTIEPLSAVAAQGGGTGLRAFS